MILAPSILAADFAHLARDIDLVNQSEADWFHLDVMDGLFVPNISFGTPVCKSIQQLAQKPLDMHLMIQQPERYIELFAGCGAASISVHYEACVHLHRTIDQIKSAGCAAGVALNPHTPVGVLEEVIELLDLVCVMSVNPGFGGQKFIPNTLTKIKKLKTLITQSGSHAKIEIDGGVGLQNAQGLMEAGADVLVAGSAVFNADHPKETISKFKQLA